jgi:hypothetical protein
MADSDRQVLARATAWLFDLTAVRGPRLVVLRGDETEAQAALARHLIDIGVVVSDEEAAELIAEARGSLVRVV